MSPHRQQQQQQQSAQVLNGRFQVVGECGRGNFASVVRCNDLTNGKTVAVKILGPEYQKDAQFELEVLQTLGREDPQHREAVCHMIGSFQSGRSTCFAFSLRGPHLKSVILQRGGMRDADVGGLVRDLSVAFRFLHFRCFLVHTDLKPENVLTRDPRGGFSHGWVVCDFGSASSYGEQPDRDLIQTRPYRAPEVVLGSAWSYAVDIWSMACLFYEARHGRKLFDAINDESHLRLLESRLGAMPFWAVQTASMNGRAHFDGQGNLTREDSVFANPFGPGVQARPLEEDLSGDPEFLDLIVQCLNYDPALRLRADEIVQHPYCIRHQAPGEGDGLLRELPKSGYSSGCIRTPAGAAACGRVPLTPQAKARLLAEQGKRRSPRRSCSSSGGGGVCSPPSVYDAGRAGYARPVVTAVSAHQKRFASMRTPASTPQISPPAAPNRYH
eukprot:Hpha_TRINITY_DN11421_c0_g1::TRINITY_DN11421_c0_g1_i1::g.137283::m.137283